MTDQTDSLDLFLEDIRDLPLLSTEEVNRLVQRIQKGDIEARNILVERNIRFVISVVKKHAPYTNIPFQDLIQEGCLGLMRAAEKFDSSRGVKFISYAVWHVRQKISHARSQQEKIVRRPSNAHAVELKVRKFRKQFRKDQGREPTVRETAEAVRETEMIVKAVFFDEAAVSFDAPVRQNHPGEERSKYAVFADPDSNPEENYIRREEEGWYAEKKKLLLGALENLSGESERNKQMFIEYACLDGRESRPTLEALGEEHGITRERVRQITMRIFESLRYDLSHASAGHRKRPRKKPKRRLKKK